MRPKKSKTPNARFDGPPGQEDMPYLLTPGPLTTSSGVKLAMLADYGSRDVEFRHIVKSIRQRLLEMAHCNRDYECVIMQGSGTFAIEAALGTLCPRGRRKKTLIVANGAYGARAAKILDALKRPHILLESDEEKPVDPKTVDAALAADPDIDVVFLVHCETTTGLINPIPELCKVAKTYETRVMLDAMSSFGAIDVDMPSWGVDALVSSSNKCIEGVPGFGYVLVDGEWLDECQGKAHSVSLDLHAQFTALEANGQFRFTPPTHALVAFDVALKEHAREGGVTARGQRYQANCDLLLKGMRQRGFQTLLQDIDSGPIIQTFLSPGDPEFDFEAFYERLRAFGYAIYPGKLTKRDSFRIGTIGQLRPEDFERFLAALDIVLKEMGVKSNAPAVE